jgi:hypothetical protein
MSPATPRIQKVFVEANASRGRGRVSRQRRDAARGAAGGVIFLRTFVEVVARA